MLINYLMRCIMIITYYNKDSFINSFTVVYIYNVISCLCTLDISRLLWWKPSFSVHHILGDTSNYRRYILPMFPPRWSPPAKASGTLHIHCLSSTSWKDLHGTQDIHDYISTSLIGDYFVECHLRCDVEVTVSVLCTIAFVHVVGVTVEVLPACKCSSER